MRELEAIISAYDQMKTAGVPCVLASVVHVEGSSYRRAGARMLVDENGSMTGAISGGCLEGDALTKALHALHQGHNKLITYDTSDEDDAVVGAQLGCNGVIQVLFEPIHFDQSNNPLELLKKVARQNETMVIITLFNLQKNKEQPGTKLLFDPKMNITGDAYEEELISALKTDAMNALALNTSLFEEYHILEEKLYAFIEICPPPPALILVGAGNDSQVLAQMAELLGWRVTIADGRNTHANPQRFSGSCRVIVSEPARILEKVRIDKRTAFILMTHNYQYDLSVLRLLLLYPEIPYIGILGPKNKYLRMIKELQNEGIKLSTEQTENIFSPMGLDLGAESASEIGISVLSEILAVLNNSTGGHLHEKIGPIHDKSNYEFKVKHL